MERIVKKTLIPAFILASTLSATAIAADDSGWFATAAIGQSDVDASDIELDQATNYKLLVGYDFTRNWAIGVEYADLGKFDVTSLFGDPLPADVSSFLEVDGVNFFGQYTQPINDSFSLFAKAGVYLWDLKATASGSEGSGSESDDGSDISWGVGAEFNVTDTAALAVEFQRFDIGGDNINTLTGGITFQF